MTPPDVADRLSVEQVAERCQVSIKSVRRWMRSGIGVRGRTVRLASLKVGHARVTCGAWLSAFLDAQNPEGLPDSAPIQTPTEWKRECDRARRELATIIGR